MADKNELVENAIDKVLDQASQDEGVDQYLSGSGGVDPNIQQAIEAEVAKEIALEQKYGDKAIEAGAGAALSTATLGISDQVLTKGFGVSPERLAESRERSPVAAGVGVGAGIILPALASSGTSLLAKGVKAAATPLEAASMLGKVATRGAEKLVEGRIRSNAIKEILKNATGMAVEGSALSLGNLVSEEALGKADFSAQNVVASVGAGAMLGAGFGAGIGGIKATVPLIKRGIAPIGAKLSSAAKNMADPELAAAELIGIRPDKMAKIQQFRPTFAEELPAFLVNKLELKPLTSAEELMTKNASVKQLAGEKIGETVKALDDFTVNNPNILPPRHTLYDRLINKLEEYQQKFASAPATFKAELQQVESYATDLYALANKRKKVGVTNEIAPASFKEMDDLRKLYGNIKYKGGGAQESFRANVAETLRQELRSIVDEAATKVASNTSDIKIQTLANNLKSHNNDYFTASLLEKYLPKKLNAKSFLGLQDVVEGAVVGGATGSGPIGAAVALGRKFGKSDLRRKAVILADIKSQGMAIEKSVKDAVSKFVKRSSGPTRQLSQKSLLNSGFAVNYESKRPAKNREEAFKNTSVNLDILNSNPDMLVERLAKSTGRISLAAPNVAQETQNTLVRAVQFLDSKLPKNPTQALLFGREYKPSSIELAKFERYMQAIEHPMSVLEDMEKGTLTREHVEAIKFVYPAIYENLRQEVLAQAMEPDSKLSYNKKLQLGILLDVPTDPSLEPVNIAGLQVNFMPQNDPMQVEAQQGALRQGNQSGLQKLNISGRTQTDTEQTSRRRENG